MTSDAMLKKSIEVTVILFILLLCGVALAQSYAHASGQVVQFNIPSSSLGKALNTFASQSGTQVSVDAALIKGKTTKTLEGEYVPEEALRQLLENTGLDHRISRNTFTLGKKNFRGSRQLSLKPVEENALPDLMAQNQTAKKKVIKKDASKKENTLRLKPIDIIADRERLREGLDSYVINDATASTKTNTPLIETPQSISIVTRKQLEDQKALNLNEALRYTPGVQSEPFGFETRFANLRLRGFDATTTGLFRDGMQLRNPNFAIGYSIEPYAAERIEIPRGPASVLYGQGNPGGLINFVSKRPTDEPIHEFLFEAGNFQFLQGKFDISEQIGGHDEFTYRLTGLFRESETQVDFVDNDRIFIAPSLTWQPNQDTWLTILTRFQQDEFGISQRLPAAGTLFANPNGALPTSTYTGEPGVERYDREEFSLGYLFEHRINNTWTVRQNVRLNSTDVDDVTIFTTSLLADNRTITRSIFENDGRLDSIAMDNQVQIKFDTGPAQHTFLAGLDFQYIEVGSRQTFGGAPNLDIFTPTYGALVTPSAPFTLSETTQDQIGLYFQDQIKIYDNWIVQLGGRQDWAGNSVNNTITGTVTEQDNDKFTFRGGLVYRSDIGLAPYFSYSQSFLQTIGTDFSQNPFKPETGEQYEFGLKYQPPGWDSFLTLSWFDLTRQNVTTPDPANVGFQVQTGEINSQGVELEAVSNLDFGLSLIGSFTYLDVEITSSNVAGEVGSTPTQTPDHMASLWADYTVPSGPLQGFGVGGGVRYMGSTFGNTPNTLEVPGYTLGDAVVHYDWEGFRVALNVQNVTDNIHIASCFAAGQNFCTFGARRTMRATVGYRW